MRGGGLEEFVRVGMSHKSKLRRISSNHVSHAAHIIIIQVA